MPKYNPAYGDKDMELSILPRFPGLTSDIQLETIDTRKGSFGTFARSPDPPGVPSHIPKSSLKTEFKPATKKSSVQFHTGN